jgi:hypothetical protein
MDIDEQPRSVAEGWTGDLLLEAGRLDETRRRWTRAVLAGLPHVPRERCWCGGTHSRVRAAWVNLVSWRLRRRVRSVSLPFRPHPWLNR